MQISRNRGLLYTSMSALIIIGVTILVIFYANGNFRRTNEGIAREAGLLSANSLPTGSQVYIDDKLTTATDDTIYLEPGRYQVKIAKDGYSDWQKTLTLTKGLVTQTNAHLFPTAPSLTPLTFTGASQILPSPDGQKVIYYTASNSAEVKNGWYVLELSDSSLLLPKGPKQIIAPSTRYSLTQAEFIWSPNSDQLLLILPNREVLLGLDQLNDIAKLPDVSVERDQILADWEQEMYLRERQYLTKFPDEVVDIATQSAVNVYFSPDKEKLLYTATREISLSEKLTPNVPPSPNTQPQERTLQTNGIYVYDRQEDTNFRVGTQPEELQYSTKLLLSQSPYPESLLETATSSAFRSLTASTSAQTAANFATYHSPLFANTLQWFPNSQHLFDLVVDTIKIQEYDGTNQTNLFSGTINDNFVYPWPDGSRLIILTSFSPNSPPNLYSIELR